MATNFLSRFAASASTSYTSEYGLRYTDEYWQDDATSIREKGFFANSPISSIQMNTILSQTSMVAYIIGEVLVSGVIQNKLGNSNDTDVLSNIDDDAVKSSYVNRLTNFFNRINQIRNNGDSIKTGESVWRSRQLSFDDTSNPYWCVDKNGVLQKDDNQSVPQIYVGSLQRSSESTANIRLTDGVITLTGNSSVNSSVAIELTKNSSAVTGPLSVNGTLNANTGITCGGTVQMGARAPIIMGSSSSMSQLQLWARYNSKGTTTDDYIDDVQNLEAILFNIGQRLDNLGFDEGSVTPGTATIGTPNVTENWIYRQGNYVIGHFTANGTSGGGWRQGDTIFTIPSGFLPKSQFTMMAGGEGSQTGRTADGRYTLMFNTNGEVVGSNASFNGVIRSIDIQFGYEALPRSSQSL